MSIRVECQDCGRRFQAPENFAGRRAKCPKCSAIIRVGTGPPQPSGRVTPEKDSEPPIPVTCGCGKKFRAKAELAGKRVKCPACGDVLAIPADRAPVAAQLVEEPESDRAKAPGPPPARALAMQRKIGVWYASEDRACSASKFLVYDDAGFLQTTEDGLHFAGRRLRVSLADIQQLSLVRQRLPWKTYLWVNSVMFVLFALTIMIGYATGDPSVWGGNPFIPLVFIICMPLLPLAAMNASALWAVWRRKWVRVDHRDDSGRMLASFFTYGSVNAWGGIFGGTARLYAALSAGTQVESAPAGGTGRAGHAELGATSAIPTTSAWAVVSLIFGILSVLMICFCFALFVTAPTAIVTGHIARYTIRHSGGQKTGAGMAMAGLVLGYVTMVVLLTFFALVSMGPITFQRTVP